MANHNNHQHVSDVEASAGSKEGVVRWVLLGGLVLAVVLLSLVWIIPAATNDETTIDATASERISEDQANQSSDTDSIVGAAEPMSDDTSPTDNNQVQEQDGLSTVEN